MTVPADRDPPSFKDYLFWYTVIQCVGAVVAFTAFFAYGAIMVRFGFANAATVARQTGDIQVLMTVVSAVFAVGVAVIVASRHGIKFGRGFAGYLVGNIISVLAILPLNYGSTALAHRFPYPWGLLAIIALILAYAFVLTMLIWGKRRHSLNRRRRAALIEPFT